MKLRSLCAAMLAALLSLVVVLPALAQWQVPENAVPVGRGAGTGFSSVSGTKGLLVTSAAGVPSISSTIWPVVVNANGWTSIRQGAVHIKTEGSGETAAYSGTMYGGSGGGMLLHGICASGTEASPSFCGAGTFITAMGGLVYDGNATPGTGGISASSPAAIHFLTAETQALGANGALINFYTTAVGSSYSSRLNLLTLTPDASIWGKDGSSGFSATTTQQTKPASDAKFVASGETQYTFASAAYGAGGGFRGLGAGGTVSSPAATAAAQNLAFLGAAGHTGSAWVTGSNGLFRFRSAEAGAFSGSAQGTDAVLGTTPVGSTTRSDWLFFQSDASLGVGVGAAKTGAGTINVTGNYYVAATLLRNVSETLTNKTIAGASNTLSVRIANDVTGLGTGVATALGVNVGSAGAFVTFNGAGGTPSSITLTNATGLPVSSGITGLGTGIAAALAVNTGSAGAPVLFNGALGTPSSGTVTNLTGTASININGTVGATTPNTGAFTTLSASGLITATGGQIVFPATQNASSDVNTLDDYEEGTFTPSIAFGGACTGCTYSTQTGTYTKIGNRVFFDLFIVMTSKGSSTGTATYTGLPFTVGDSAPMTFTYNNMAAGVTTWAMGNAASGTTGGSLQRYAAGTVTNLADTDFTNTSVLRVSGHYKI